MSDELSLSQMGLPTSFGGDKSPEDSVQNRLDKAMRLQFKQHLEKKQQQKESNDSDSDDDDDDSDEDSPLDELPVSHDLVIPKGHDKTVSSISIDSSGTRMVTSSHDTQVNFWDFNNMNSASLHPFRSVEPMEGYQIHAAHFSPCDKLVLVIPRFNKPLIVSRDGGDCSEFIPSPVSTNKQGVLEFSSGDMYLMDMKNTKGHTAEINAGCWDQSGGGTTFSTASNDSTIRIWDVQNTKSQRDIIVVRSKGSRGDKVKVTSLMWSGGEGTNQKSLLTAGTSTGLISCWDSRGQFTRPAQFVEAAHEGEFITSIVGRPGTDMFATRGIKHDDNNSNNNSRTLTGSIKIWDSRQLKSPVLCRENVACGTEESQSLIFDPRPYPNGQYLLSAGIQNQIEVLDLSDLTTVLTLDLHEKRRQQQEQEKNDDDYVTCLNWNPQLNQIFAGTSSGSIVALFNPSSGGNKHNKKGGAQLVIEKQPKRQKFDDDSSLTVNISAQGLEEGIAQEQELQRKRRNKRNNNNTNNQEENGYYPNIDDYKTKKSYENKADVWEGPSQDFLKNKVHLSELAYEDPREALLKYEEKVKNFKKKET